MCFMLHVFCQDKLSSLTKILKVSVTLYNRVLLSLILKLLCGAGTLVPLFCDA